MNEEQEVGAEFYVAGGTIKPGTESYIVRSADEELFEAIRAGEFCYVLTTRQIGKSSLMVHTAIRLAQVGVRCAQVDLTTIGADKKSVTADQWYYGVSHKILKDLKIQARLDNWWQEHRLLPAVQRFTEFLGDLVLTGSDQRFVVFIDEIDSTIGLPFSDDFFAAIRACFNVRATDKAFERLTFVLLGVATPPQLISDPQRTPFNVGKGIELTDFSADEAEVLATRLEGDHILKKQLLDRILYWTGGHPYLTQALCRTVAETREHISAGTPRKDPSELIDGLVRETFLSAQAARNEGNLKFVSDRIRQGHSDLRKVLRLYARALKGKRVEDRPASSLHASLKLSGVVKPDDHGLLRVRNRIYENVFDLAWVHREMPSRAMPIAISGAISLVLAIVVFWYTVLQPAPYIQTLRTSSSDADAYRAYSELHKNFAYREKAANLLATFWEGRGERDKALLTTFRGLTEHDTEEGRRSVTELTGADYPNLLATYRYPADGVFGAGRVPPFEVVAVALSPDGKQVLTGTEDMGAQLWDAATGKPSGEPLQQGGGVWAVAFSPDGKQVLTGSNDRTAQLWDAATGKPSGGPLLHEAAVRAVAFSPDGKELLTGSFDNTARLWDAATGKPVGETLVHQDYVFSVAFSPDGKRVLTGSRDGTARLWDAATGKPSGEPLQQEGGVWAVAFSPDGKEVLTGGKDNTARLWDATTGKPLGEPLQHEGVVWAVAFSPDGKELLTASEDDTVQLWDPETREPLGEPLRHLGGMAKAVAFSREGTHVLTGGGDGTARLWDFAAGKPLGELLRYGGRVWIAAFSPDRKQVLTSSADNTAHLWDAATGKSLGESFGHDGPVNAVAFSADGKRVLTGSNDKTARLWDAKTCKAVGELLGHNGPVKAVAFSPDGKQALTGSDDNTARLWDVRTCKPLGEPLRHKGPVHAVTFSPDGNQLLTGSVDNTAQLWDATTCKPLGGPLKHYGEVKAVAFSPDGKRVLTGCSDSTARLWDAATGTALSAPMHHQASVVSVAFTTDGNMVLIATGNWLNLRSFKTNSLELVGAKLLAGRWTGAFSLEKGQGMRVTLILRDTESSTIVRSLSFSEIETPPIQGPSTGLLSEWRRRLALTFDPQGRIVPSFNVTVSPPKE